jgi:hypothetical protein
MSTIDTNDITGMVIVVMGLVIVVLNVHNIRVCIARDRWIYGFYAVSGLAISISFILAIVDTFTGGSGLVPPELGRPSVILLVGSVVINSILHYKKGRC